MSACPLCGKPHGGKYTVCDGCARAQKLKDLETTGII